MDPLSVGLITGGANLLGSMFSSTTSAQNTQQQIQASEQQQATQNAFTEQMSNTAYQRATADMKAAGLNPMMMFGSGSAASTPSGSSIQVPTPQRTNPLAGIGQAATQALGSAVQAKTIDKMTDEIANLKATEARTAAETATELQRPKLVAQETSAKQAQEGLTRREQQLVAERTKSAQIGHQVEGNEATQALHERELREKFPWMDQARLAGKSASDVVAPFVSSAFGARRFMPDRWFW